MIESHVLSDKMAGNDNSFDPFGLQEESSGRPVLIAVSEGQSEHSEGMNGQQGPIHSTESFDPFGIGEFPQQDLKPKGETRPESPKPPPR